MDVTGETTIYRKDFDGRPVYSRRISAKKFENGRQIDEWIGVYEPVQLPKGTLLDDKTKITVVDAFESVYQNRNGEVQRKLVIRKFKTDSQVPAVDEEIPNDFAAINDDVPF